MSNPSRVHISEMKFEYTNSYNSISCCIENHVVTINFNQNEANLCFFLIRMREQEFLGLFKTTADNLKCLGLNQYISGGLTLEILIASFSLALDLGSGWPASLTFLKKNSHSEALMDIKLTWLSPDQRIAMILKTDSKADSCTQETKNLKKSIESKADSSEMLKLATGLEALSTICQDQRLKIEGLTSQIESLTRHFNDMNIRTAEMIKTNNDMTLDHLKSIYDKKFDDLQMSHENFDIKCNNHQKNINDINYSIEIIERQLTDQELKIPTFNELEQIDSRLSVLEKNLIDSIKPNDPTLIKFQDNAPLTQKNEVGSVINGRKALSSEDTKKFTPEEMLKLYEELKSNTTLISLDLRGKKINVPGADLLAHALKLNTTLISLDLGANCLGDAGTIFVSYALKINKTLQSIDLMGNGIGDAGAEALAVSLKVNTSINSIDLMLNNIGFAGKKLITDAMKSKTSCSFTI